MICSLLRFLEKIGKLVPIVWILEIYTIARTLTIVLLAAYVIFHQIIKDFVSRLLTF